jgi:replicative DNA helicase
VIVAEGVLDALSANAAGFRAAAVLGAALVGDGHNERGSAVADRLAELDAPLILAFDADEAGQRGSKALQGALHERGVRTARVHVPAEANDLNAWMLTTRNWDHALASAVRTAVTASARPRSLAR